MSRVCYVPSWLWVEFTTCRNGYGSSLSWSRLLCAKLAMGQVCHGLSLLCAMLSLKLTTLLRLKKVLSALYLVNQWVDFDQTCVEALLGHGKEVIRFGATLTLFSRSQEILELGLSTLHLLNQLMGSDQTHMDTSQG